MPAKLKDFILHETIGFWKTHHDVIKFWYHVIDKKMTRHFSCVLDIRLWLKFGGHTINRTTVYFIYFIRILSGSFSPCVFHFKEMLSTYTYKAAWSMVWNYLIKFWKTKIKIWNFWACSNHDYSLIHTQDAHVF